MCSSDLCGRGLGGIRRISKCPRREILNAHSHSVNILSRREILVGCAGNCCGRRMYDEWLKQIDHLLHFLKVILGGRRDGKVKSFRIFHIKIAATLPTRGPTRDFITEIEALHFPLKVTRVFIQTVILGNITCI